MKKLSLVLTLFLSSSLLVNAQDEKSGKFRFGLQAQPAFTWYKTDSKKLSSGGTKLKFAWGLSTEFKFTENIWFCTGLSVNYDGGVLNFLDSTKYFKNVDGYAELSAVNSADYVKYDMVHLKKRTYNVTYVTLPLNLKMKTNEIGYMRYYGLFGLSLGFRAKATASDEGTELRYASGALSSGNLVYAQPNTGYNEEKTLNNSDMQIFRTGLNIGGGVEWNISGSTSLVFGATYNLGFSNVLKSESKFLLTNTNQAFKQKATSQNILITIGVLF
jgi:hypothetical protein